MRCLGRLATQLMDCPNCGLQLPPEGRVCPNCLEVRPVPKVPRGRIAPVVLAVLVVLLIGVYNKDKLGGDFSSTVAKPSSTVVSDVNSGSVPALPISQPPNLQNNLFRVLGVAREDMLNVRTRPGATSPIAGQLPNDTAGIRITGDEVSIGQDVWVPFQTLQISGWVNATYLTAERQ